jgi:hypothetical protein
MRRASCGSPVASLVTMGRSVAAASLRSAASAQIRPLPLPNVDDGTERHARGAPLLVGVHVRQQGYEAHLHGG